MSRAVLAPFEAYQKARVTFVQTVAELAQRPQNIEALQSAGKLSDPQDSRIILDDRFLTALFRCDGPAAPSSPR